MFSHALIQTWYSLFVFGCIIVAAQHAHLSAMKKSMGNEKKPKKPWAMKIKEQWQSTRAQNSTSRNKPNAFTSQCVDTRLL